MVSVLQKAFWLGKNNIRWFSNISGAIKCNYLTYWVKTNACQRNVPRDIHLVVLNPTIDIQGTQTKKMSKKEQWQDIVCWQETWPRLFRLYPITQRKLIFSFEVGSKDSLVAFSLGCCLQLENSRRRRHRRSKTIHSVHHIRWYHHGILVSNAVLVNPLW